MSFVLKQTGHTVRKAVFAKSLTCDHKKQPQKASDKQGKSVANVAQKRVKISSSF